MQVSLCCKTLSGCRQHKHRKEICRIMDIASTTPAQKKNISIARWSKITAGSSESNNYPSRKQQVQCQQLCCMFNMQLKFNCTVINGGGCPGSDTVNKEQRHKHIFQLCIS
jgi:hypothetical protein